jgi:hypothetical protein
VPRTFGRLIKRAELNGLSFYRLRHTTKSLGKAARDAEALDLLMGHANHSIGKLYDHSEIDYRRTKRVAIAIKKGLWPRVRPRADSEIKPRNNVSCGGKASERPEVRSALRRLDLKKVCRCKAEVQSFAGAHVTSAKGQNNKE